MNTLNKLSNSDLFFILHKNINEPSILIRKKIIKIIIQNLEEKSSEIQEFHLKSILLIFIDKINDATESEGIKLPITEFLIRNLKKDRPKKKIKLTNLLIDTFVSILQENENPENSVNHYHDKIKGLFTRVLNNLILVI